MIDEKSIIENLKLISKNITKKDILIEFEELLEHTGLYAYANWFDGEIVDGPVVSKYWVEITLMYPYKCMPDPKGGLRLQSYNTKVTFQEAVHKHPVQVSGPDDINDEITKSAKLQKDKVWLVNIKMPAKYIQAGIDDFINVDIADIEQKNAADVDPGDDL